MTVAKCSQDMHHGLNDDGLTVKSAQLKTGDETPLPLLTVDVTLSSL